MKKQSKLKPQDILRQARLRRTPGRVAILKILLRAHKPLTREKIALKLGKKKLNKATIYRALECFIQASLVHKAFLRDRIWNYELAHNCTDYQCHPHFTCNNCNDTQCLTEVSVPLVKPLQKGFVIQRQQTRLEGLCPDCSNKKGRSPLDRSRAVK